MQKYIKLDSRENFYSLEHKNTGTEIVSNCVYLSLRIIELKNKMIINNHCWLKNSNKQKKVESIITFQQMAQQAILQ